MPEQQDVKVFISWSGDLSRGVSVALRDWLPLLFDRVKPWASDTDIAAGQRGLASIEKELTATQFGIVVVTAANQTAPWINFEAGALSKTIAGGEVEQRVVPFLVDLSGPSQLTGPLSQFQAKVATREGTLSLLRSLASVAGLDDAVLTTRFDALWPTLAAKIEAARADSAAGADRPVPKRRDPADVLDEILLHVRQLRAASEAGVFVSAEDLSKRLLFAAAHDDSPWGLLSADLLRPRRQEPSFDTIVKRLAEEFGLQVDRLSMSGGGGDVRVTVGPLSGTASDPDVDGFTHSLQVAAGPSRNVEVVAIPF